MPKRRASTQFGRQTIAKKARRGIRPPSWYGRRRMPQTLTVVRSTTGNLLNGTTGTSSGLAVTFQLSNMPAFSEFVNLFDRYKILRIMYRFRVYKSPDVVAPNLYPVIFHAVDNNDSTTPTSTNILEYPNLKTTVLSDSSPVSKWFSFRPRVSIAVQPTSFAAFSPWVDTASSSANHYGLKFWFDQQATGINIAWDYKFVISLKDVK